MEPIPNFIQYIYCDDLFYTQKSSSICLEGSGRFIVFCGKTINRYAPPFIFCVVLDLTFYVTKRKEIKKTECFIYLLFACCLVNEGRILLNEKCSKQEINTIQRS